MEYVPGRTLRDLLRAYGPLAPEQALVFLDPVLEALSAAHAAGFVHRDIKPENVLISDDGRVKVADFGLARALQASPQSVTQGMIIGTVAYLSPEQVERGDADQRSDVYAAGILLFEMITGQVPHAGDSPLSVAYQHVNSDVPAPSIVRPGLPAEMDALVVSATRRDPALRYQNATDFLADVRQVRALLPPPRPFVDARDTLIVDAGALGRAAAPPPAASPPAGSPPRGASAPPPAPTPPRRRSRAPWVVLGLLLAVLVAAVAGWYVAAGRTVPTPDVTGQDVPAATATLAEQGLLLAVGGEEFSETVPVGAIITTDPAPGAGVQPEGTVSAIVSRGPERYDVPDVKGLAQAAAEAAITEANLAVGQVTEEFDDRVDLGAVVSTSPKIGSPQPPGTPVDIVISKGPRPVPVPDVAGLRQGPARDTLTAAGLKVSVTERFSERVVDGVVISVRPKAGSVVDSGSRVELVVSKGPPPVEVPNLIDLPRDRAVATLRRLGLQARVLEGAVTPLDRVLSQDPPPGTKIPKGSTVTLRII
jgi:serine/threonine-protein kinase